jgi:hypothetical protein
MEQKADELIVLVDVSKEATTNLGQEERRIGRVKRLGLDA